MKKKILVVSLAANIIAGAFVFYSFTSNKAKSMNDEGGYVVMRVVQGAVGDLSISDGNNMIDHEDLHTGPSKEHLRLDNQIIAKKINDLSTKGYQVVSSNGGDFITNYILIKK